MNKITFTAHILPHIIAVLVFLGITIAFFNPIFFDNKSLAQHDIQQYRAISKSLKDYRLETGEEGLWVPSIFSGMPAYLVNVHWHFEVILWIKGFFSFGLPHPVANVYWAFLSYYILLLAFRVRPLFAIAGALAFGLSSYMIIGLAAGHNSRIGSISYLPLIMAGIHLAFSGKRWLGVGITALGMAMNLFENHVQMTYYLLIIVLVYGLVQLIIALRERHMIQFCTNVGVLVPAILLAISSVIAPIWALMEYSKYSIRGVSELKVAEGKSVAQGLDKDYAFAYSNGLVEPMTLLIPNFYGGSSTNFLVQDRQSAVHKALVRQRDSNVSNSLMRYTSAYWGPQSYTSPYYAGAVIVFLFALGVAYAEKKYVWWLASVSVLGIVLSWGSNFSTFNYFMFDYFPGYNKFRSVTFALIIPLFAMPLLGMLGLEKLLKDGLNKEIKRKFLLAFLATGGLCLLLWLFAGLGDFFKTDETRFPPWFLDALKSDRRSLFRGDAFRSLTFISIFSALLFFTLQKKIKYAIFSILFILIMVTDLFTVARRYLNANNYQRKHHNAFPIWPVDEEILNDKSYYRVWNVQESWSQEARTAYFHNSIGGYHGAKLRRYQDIYDSCLQYENARFVEEARQGKLNFNNYNGLNMLNVKYIIFGPKKDNFINNPEANGNAWFVKHVEKVSSPTEELEATCRVDARIVAVIDSSKFKIPNFQYDSLSVISLQEFTPARLSYTSTQATNSLAVFSEVFYPIGWHAFIDGREVPILRVNYLLRALEIPSGTHQIIFKFEPKPYVIGNEIQRASSWVLLLLVLFSVGLSIKNAPHGVVFKKTQN